MLGISQTKLFTDLTKKDIDNMIDINLKSVLLITQEVVKNMLQRQNGCIINISSVWGITGGSCEVHYSAAKAGMIGFSKALAKEMALSNIRVNAIAPGCIDTDMTSYLTEEEREEIKNEIPLKRIGTPKDVANCAYMLTQNEYITGQVITVDGRLDKLKNREIYPLFFYELNNE